MPLPFFTFTFHVILLHAGILFCGSLVICTFHPNASENSIFVIQTALIGLLQQHLFLFCLTLTLCSCFINGQVYAWPAYFYSKQVFGPPTDKSQPIWIKFCVLLYGIHLWVNLDCDWHVGGSRPNQNDYFFFCNTYNAP